MTAGRRTVWSIAASVVLSIRLIATLATIGTAIIWVIAAFRDGLLNGWLWWAIGSAATLLVATYLYSHLRVRYPSAGERWEE